MRKVLLITIFTSLFFNAFAQKSEVIIDSTESKSAIYSKTLIQITKNWENADKVIQLKDESSGTIIVKGNLKTTNSNKDITKTEITFNIKEGKAKITFENTILWNPGFTKTYENPTKWYMKWKDQVTIEIDTMIKDYKDYLLKASDF